MKNLSTITIIFLFLSVFNTKNGWAQCPTSNFSFSINNQCTQATVSFTNTSTASNQATYQWDFGNGITSPDENPGNRTYNPATNDETFQVRLIVNDTTCSDTSFQSVRIITDIYPTATYAVPAIQCAPATLTFDGSGSTSGGSIVSITDYAWNINSTSYSTASVTETFDPVGIGVQSYASALIVTNSIGCTDVHNPNFSINRKPDASIKQDGSNDPVFAICGDTSTTSFRLEIDNVSFTRFTDIHYNIDWGDGTADFDSAGLANTVYHDYIGQGYSTLVLTITGSNNCTATKSYQVYRGTNPAVGLNIPSGTISLCSSGEIIFPVTGTSSNSVGTEYTVTFSDGTADVIYQHPPPTSISHIFDTSSCGYTTITGVENSFYVRVEASNPCFFSEAVVSPIQVGQIPVAQFDAQQTICEGTDLTFTNTSYGGNTIEYSQSQGVYCDSSITPTWEIVPMTGVTYVGATQNSITANFSLPGTYDVSVMVGNGCGNDTLTKTICVVPNPIANYDINTNSNSDTIGCAPFTISNIINTSNIVTGVCSETYNWSVTSLSSDCPNGSSPAYTFINSTSASDKNPEIRFEEAGQYELTLLIDNECVTNSSYTRTITVQDKPSFSLSTINDFCQNATVSPTLNSFNECYSPVSTWQWTAVSGGSIDNPNQQNPGAISFNSSGSKTISVTATNVCGSTPASQSFVINPLPALPNILGNPLCSGETILIATSNGENKNNVTYNWEGPNGYTNGDVTLITRPNAQASMAGDYLLTSTLNDATQCFDTISVYIPVNPLPILTLTPDNPNPCKSSPITITATGADTYNWVYDNGNEANSNLTISPTQDTFYTVTGIISNTSCETTDSLQITTKDLPIVNGGVDIEPCFQTPTTDVQLTGTQNEGNSNAGDWTPIGSIGSNTLTINGLFTPNQVGNYNVLYTYTSPTTTCIATDTVNINVISPQNANAGADQVVCQNSAIINFAQLIGTTDGIWRDSINNQVNSFNPTTAGTFTFSYSIGSGSCETIDDLIITVNALPTVNVQADFSICRNENTIDITENIQGGTWSGDGLANINSGIFDPSTPSLNSTETLTYQYTDANNCTNFDNITITVNDVTTANAGQDITLCNITNDYQLTGFSPSGGTWSGNGFVNGSTDLFNSNGVSGTYTLTYTYINNATCEDSDDLIITVNDLVKPVINNDLEVCKNTSIITLTEDITGGNWTLDNAPYNSNTYNPTTAGTFIFIYTIEENTTCEAADTFVLTVRDLPTITPTTPVSLCEDAAPINLSASPAGGNWLGNGITDATNGTFDVSVFNIGNASETKTVSYTVTNVHNCIDSGFVNINIHPLPIVNVPDSITYCLVADDIILPTDASNTGTWSGTGIVSSTEFNAIQNGATGVGVYFPVYTFTDNNTCTNQDTLQVRIEDADSISAGQPDTVCIYDAAFTLTNFYPTTGIWSGNGVDGSGLFTPITAGVGLATLTLTVGNGTCLLTDTKTVYVVDTPTVFAGNDQTACLNVDTIQLTGYSPTTGIWSGGNITPNGQFTPNGATTYTVTYTITEDLNGCQNADDKEITVHPLAIIDAGRDTLLCTLNNTIPLPNGTSNTSGNHLWTGSNGIINNVNLSVNPSIIGVDTVSLFYTFTDNFGCILVDSFELKIDAPLNINAGIDTSLCINTGLYTFVAVEPAGGIWTSSPSNITSTGVFDSDNATAGNYILTYEYDDGNGTCIVSDSRTVTVLARPIVNAGVDEILCFETAPFALSGYSPVIDGTGTWTGNGISNLDTFSVNAAGVAGSPHTLTYTFIDNDNCENFDTKIITIVPLPVIDSLVGLDTLCNQPIGEQYIGHQNSGNQNDGIWSSSTSGLISPNGIFTPNGEGTFTIKYCYTDANNNNCENCDSMQVTVIAPFNIDAGANDTVCFNTGNYTLLPIEPQNGTWTSATAGFISTDGIYNSNIAPNTYTVTYTVGSVSCQISDIKTVTVRDTPVVFAGNDEMVCIETPPYALTNYSLITSSAGTGTWTGNGVTALGVFSSDVAGVNAVSHTLTYTYIDTFGCQNADDKNILVVPLPVIDSLIGPDTICNQPIAQLYVGYQNEGASNDGAWTGTHIDSSGNFTPNGVGNYTITYCYRNSNDCDNCDSMVVTVIEPDSIEAGIADTICIDEGIHILTAETPQGGIWLGSTAILDAQLGTFDPLVATGGWHTVTYQYGSGTCFIQDTTGVYVRDLAFVDAGANQFACDTDADFAIAGFSPLGGTWSGTGINDPIGTFSPIAVTPNTYSVTYHYIDPMTGCDTTRIKTVTIHPLSDPAFSSDTILCRDVPFNLLDQSANTVQWNWNFGDNSTSSLQNPTHTYTATGYYTIQLIATSVHGCIDSTQMTVYVSEIPTPYFVKDTMEGCAPLPVNFTDSSSGDFIVYAWNMGNGNTYSQANPPTQTYLQGTSDSTYFITINTSNLCGDSTYLDSIITFPIPQIAFSPDVNSGCTPLTVDFYNGTLGNPDIFYWDFGNGLDTTFNNNTVSHTFYTDTVPTVYTVRLVAKNDCGFDTVYTTITVNPVTVQSFFNVDTTVGCAPLAIDFSDFSTQGTTLIYNFGDGGTGTTGDTTYTFQQAGLYKVVQYVTNGCGYDSTFVMINVLPAPVASFTNVASECEDLPVIFTNTSQNTTGQLWDFGDGNTSVNSPIAHTFDTAGTYNVTLTVYANASQCPASTTQSITILPKPIADFNIDNANVCFGIPITVTDNSIGNITGTIGDLGDGNSFGALPITHTYADSGVYSISYVVEDANTCVSDTTFKNVVIYPLPTSDFSYEIIDSCLIPASIKFTNLSQGAVSYLWNLDNGQNLTVTNPFVFYNFAGDYTVNLTATNPYGCQDSSQQSFELHTVPVANFAFSQIDDCEPSLVQFSNTSTNANSYFWDLGNGETSILSTPQAIYNRGDYDITLIVGADSACFDTLSFTDLVTVHPTPTANFYWLDTMIDERFKGVVKFHNTSIEATKYVWDFDDNAQSTDESPVYHFRSNDVYNVVLVAENEFGCLDDTTVPVQPDIFGTLVMPNVFAPEFGIGEDAYFIPKGVGIEAGTFLAEVFDKAGERVWFCDEVDEEGTPNCKWDGTYSGKILPQGAYVWKVKATFLNGKSVHYTGTVTLIR
ncbi:MAG: PKD domain-containing protein [Saprospiraceae bacterium]